MRFIPHPTEPILVPARAGDGSRFEMAVLFADFFDQVLTSDERSAKSFRAIETTRKIRERLKASKPGGHISLEDADFEHVKAVFESPAPAGYAPALAQPARDWIHSILNASDKEPPKRPRVIKATEPASEPTEPAPAAPPATDDTTPDPG
jgi:hypothetical protein